jgi:hypothetical protein
VKLTKENLRYLTLPFFLDKFDSVFMSDVNVVVVHILPTWTLNVYGKVVFSQHIQLFVLKNYCLDLFSSSIVQNTTAQSQKATPMGLEPTIPTIHDSAGK